MKLGIIPVTGGETVWVKFDSFEYLARVDWGKGGLVYQMQSRDQKVWEVGAIDPKTGECSQRSLDLGADDLPWQELTPGLPLSTEFGGERAVVSGSDQVDQNSFPNIPGAGDRYLLTNRLFEQGLRRIAQKVGEEGVETALAAVAQDEAALVSEAADLLFHLAVLLRARGLGLADAVAELERRHR